jgi:hypothetical protein
MRWIAAAFTGCFGILSYNRGNPIKACMQFQFVVKCAVQVASRRLFTGKAWTEFS